MDKLTFSYRGYDGMAVWDDDDSLWHGQILMIRDVITFFAPTTGNVSAETIERYIEAQKGI
jgi:predicted HicB family RNase H-like nuclease